MKKQEQEQQEEQQALLEQEFQSGEKEQNAFLALF